MRLALVLVFGLMAAPVFAQSADEQRSRDRIELLETKLKLANQEIEQLKAEVARLEGRGSAGGRPVAPKVDAFAAGTVWTGEFRVAKSENVGKCVLTINKRTGERFEGDIVASDREGNKVEGNTFTGTAPVGDKGAVTITTARQGFAQSGFRGKLENDQLSLIFLGTDKFGKQKGGAATLRKRN